MILLDTHVLVWFMRGDDRVGRRTCEMIDAAARMGEAYVSAITPWEISMLVAKGRFRFGVPVTSFIDAALAKPGLRLAPITPAIGVDAGQLPTDIRGDPADRLIVATARALSCPLATVDGPILRYAAAGHFQAIDARR
jgi:PIN domain nuclease of toxin-antitoxin system